MIKCNLTRLLLLTTTFLPLSVVEASDNKALENEARTFLQLHLQHTYPDSRINISLNPISTRVKLVTCKQPVQFKPSRTGSSRVSLRANCTQPRWQIYMTAKVQITKPVLVTNRAILKNQIIQAQDLSLRDTDITTLRNQFFTHMDAVVGKAAKYNLGSGRVIKSSMLADAILIRKDDAVIIEAGRGVLTIRTAGTALSNGKEGQQIAVRNDKSGRVVKAFVIAPGLVRTP